MKIEIEIPDFASLKTYNDYALSVFWHAAAWWFQSSGYWNLLQEHGKWLPVNGDDNNRQWVPTQREGK